MTFSKKVSGRMLQKLIIATLVIIAIHICFKYISIVLFNQEHAFLFELSNRLDVNDENSVPQWFSQLLFLLIGASSLLAAYLQTQKASKAVWITIGVLGILLSLDDVATIHEFILQNIHITLFFEQEASFFVNAWLVLLPFVLLISGIIAWFAWKNLPRRTASLLIIGGLIYVLGKITMDSLANTTDDLFLDAGLAQGFEKLFQYTGASVVLYAIIDYLETHHGTKIKQAIVQLRHK